MAGTAPPSARSQGQTAPRSGPAVRAAARALAALPAAVAAAPGCLRRIGCNYHGAVGYLVPAFVRMLSVPLTQVWFSSGTPREDLDRLAAHPPIASARLASAISGTAALYRSQSVSTVRVCKVNDATGDPLRGSGT